MVSFMLFCSYDVKIPVTSGFAVLCIPEESHKVFRQHLNSFSDWSLVGMFVLISVMCINTSSSIVLAGQNIMKNL